MEMSGIGSPLGPWPLQSQVVTEQALHLIRQLLVTLKTKMPLLHYCGYLVWMTNVVVVFRGGRTIDCFSVCIS